MHSSRVRTACAMTGHAYHAHPPLPHMPLLRHACPPSPCMPPLCHACPPPFHHACPPLPHTPPRSNHVCPPSWEQPCIPPRAIMHAPRSNHACPPGTTMHPPEQPRMPTPHPSPPEQPRTPPLVDRQTPVKTKNITFANFVCGR